MADAIEKTIRRCMVQLMWGLASYGADRVRAVIELLQSDVARNMGALGAPNLSQLSRSMVRVHRR